MLIPEAQAATAYSMRGGDTSTLNWRVDCLKLVITRNDVDVDFH